MDNSIPRTANNLSGFDSGVLPAENEMFAPAGAYPGQCRGYAAVQILDATRRQGNIESFRC